MIHLTQEPDSNNCGQVCLAMITDKSVARVQRVMGFCHPMKGATRTKDLIRALKRLDFNTLKNKLTRLRNTWDDAQKLPLLKDGYYILKMTFISKTNHGHWVVLKDGWIYDPGQKESYPFFHYREFIEYYFRPTSYLEVIKGDLNV